MVNNRLLEKELKWYKDMGIDMKPVKYKKDIFKYLFDKYNDYGMCEHSYCCYGLEHSCWTEVVEEGNFGLTLGSVKLNILRNIKESKKYLYNGRKYGSNRLYIGYKDGTFYMYIYLRDKLWTDYSIWFNNKNNVRG